MTRTLVTERPLKDSIGTADVDDAVAAVIAFEEGAIGSLECYETDNLNVHLDVEFTSPAELECEIRVVTSIGSRACRTTLISR